MAKMRWIVGAGALLVAGTALYVLFDSGAESGAESGGRSEQTRPALDDIDAESRAAMRDLLREAAAEE